MLKYVKSISVYNHLRIEDYDTTCQMSNSLGLFILRREISDIYDNRVWGSEKDSGAGRIDGDLPFQSYLYQCYMGFNIGIRSKVLQWRDLLADSQSLVSAILRSALYQCVLLGESLTQTTLCSLFAKLGNNNTFCRVHWNPCLEKCLRTFDVNYYYHYLHCKQTESSH